MEPDLESLLKLSVTTAAEAGLLLQRAGQEARHVRSAEGKDVKLQADVDSETFIRQRLSGSTPYALVGEEEGGDGTLLDRDEPYWIIDPLDGTANYLKGLPLACVSIALWRGTEPLLGAVYDFYRDEMISGIADGPNRGVYLNGVPSRPEYASGVGSATFYTGFPVAMDFSPESLEELIGQVRAYRKTRSLGTSAMATAFVGLGRIDAYFERGIRLWDIAAGFAIVRAAGGVIHFTVLPGADEFLLDAAAAGREDLLPTPARALRR